MAPSSGDAITRDTSTGALVDSIQVECKVAQRHGYGTGLELQEEMLENFVAARAVFGMSLSLHSVRVFRRRRAVHAPRLVVSVPQEKEPDLPGAQKKWTTAFAIESRPVAPLLAPPSRRELRLG